MVTGVAGAIGAAVARVMSDDGYAVIGADRDSPIGSLGLTRFLRVDLGAGDSFPSFQVSETALAHVFHVAGGASGDEVDSVGIPAAASVIRSSLSDNLVAAMDLLTAVHDRVEPGGSVTLVSSINAVRDYGLPAYSAAKAGLSGLVAATAPDLARRKVRLNIAMLGTVEHPGVHRLHERDPRHFDRLRRAVPAQRFLTVEEAGRTIAAIGVSMIGVYGRTIVVDNGQLLGNPAL